MRTPWANVALLLLLLTQLITGYFGFTNGRLDRQWLLWLHGLGAYAILLLFYWKSDIIRFAWQRKKRWTHKRRAYGVLLLLLLLTLLSGLLWTFSGPTYLAGFSLVSLHMYLAVPLLLLMAWHAYQMRFVWRLPATVGRRLFLALIATGGLGWMSWRLAGWSKVALSLPGSRRRFTGSYETGTLSGRFPVVSWLLDRPAPVDLSNWELVIEGAVAQPRRFSYAELSQLATEEVMATLDCTGGWYTTQVWRGVAVDLLLAESGLLPEASSVTVEAMSGYKRRFTLLEARRYLLATAVGERPLSHGHGFPLRLVAPDQRGVNWVKWVTRLRVNRSGKWLQSPLPLQ